MNTKSAPEPPLLWYNVLNVVLFQSEPVKSAERLNKRLFIVYI